jgi:hypothetical protein
MIDGSAYLQISSATRTAASIAEALGIPGAEMAEKGDPRLNVKGKPNRGPRPLYEYAFWSVSVDGDEAASTAPDDDTAGFASLRLLVAQFAGKAPILRELRGSGEYRMLLSWWGTSGSSQGGFVLPLGLLTAIVELGCDLYGNVYSHEEDEPAPGHD